MEKDIEFVLERGVSEILPSKKALASLLRKRKISLYQGFDPTMKNLHIGHMAGIRKLAQFQKLGHKVIFLIGDFTAIIGDPSGKNAARKRLTRKQILENLEGYKEQAGRILSFDGPNAAEVKFNSKWLTPITFEEIVKLSSHFTVQQMLERDFFQQRLKKKKPIYLHEFLYPLMQGYDCVVMGVDLEIGGNDQLFNMLAGRTLAKALNKKDKFVLTTKLLAGEKGAKMGKTEGNAINLTDSPIDMFGKIMALPDDFINSGIELLTDLPLNTQETKGAMNAKKALAFEVVRQIQGQTSATNARKEFEKRFQGGSGKIEPGEVGIPESVKILEDVVSKVEGLSKSEAKRLISQGGVDVNGKREQNPKAEVHFPSTLKVGKALFVRVIKK